MLKDEPPNSTLKYGDVSKISSHLRETLHDINNSLFVAKGFIEELRLDVEQEKFLESEFDLRAFKGMFEAVARNIVKLDHSVQSLRDFVKSEIFRAPYTVGTDPDSDYSK